MSGWVRLLGGVGLRWRRSSFGWGCAAAASPSGGAAPARLRLVLRPERASTGRLGATAAPVLGLWRASGARFCVCAPRAVVLPPQRPGRWVCRPSQRSTGGRSTAEGVSGGSASPFSWTVPREGRSAAHPTLKGTQHSSFVRSMSNASAFTTGIRSKRSILEKPAHERRSLRPTRPTARELRPLRPPAVRSRLFRRPRPTRAEAAHRRAQSPRASAPARSRRRQAAHQQAPDPQAHPPTRRSPRRRGPVGASNVCARGERQVTRWGACRGWRPSCDARGACGRSYP